jgi:phospholipase C
MGQDGISRREALKRLGMLGAGAAVAGVGGSGMLRGMHSAWAGPPEHGVDNRFARRRLRAPGSRPYPKLPEGVDTLPQIEHVIVVMMENHSYDDHFGMLNRGDGFRLDHHRRPLDANPYQDDLYLRAFHMPSTCQLSGHPGQAWNTSHTAFDNGRNDGFVKGSGPVAMGYWDGSDIPFYYGLGQTFPVCDRWFCSVLAQTYPNRRFLMAGTAAGIVTTTAQGLTAPPPPNGTIFDRFAAHGIPWRNYYTDLPSTAIIVETLSKYPSNYSPIAQYFSDAAAGTLPSFCIVDPNFEHQSEENPQDLRAGEQFAANVINAAMHGPAWPKTLLLWMYDEHGGYYDHVAPPPAVAPDDIPPGIDTNTQLLPGGYDRYGFRVPAVIVSPYARRRYVSSVVHDHTSVLKLVETKWNLGALTYRDANADNLLDSLRFEGRPHFIEPPELPAPALAHGPDLCVPGDPGGAIPPPDAVQPLRNFPPLRVGAIYP